MKKLRDKTARFIFRLFIGSSWNLIAVGFAQGSTFIINIILARILGQKIFGEYSMVIITLLTISGILQLSMGCTSTKYVAEFRSANSKKTERIIGLCAKISVIAACAGAIALVTVASWMSSYALKAPHLKTPLIIGSGFLLFSSINGFQIGVIAGLEKYKSLAKAGILGGIIAIIGVSSGALWLRLNGAIIGLLFASIIRFLIYNICLRTELRNQGLIINFKNSKQEKNVLFKFAIPGAIMSFYSLSMIWWANSILVRQDNGYLQMALYSVANNIRIMALFIPRIMNNVSLSILNFEKAKKDQYHFYNIFKINVAITFLIILFSAIIFALNYNLILGLFGKNFLQAKPILYVLLISTIFEGISLAIYQYIQSYEKLWIAFFGINIPREAIFVLMAFILVPQGGAVGLAWSYLVAYFYGLLSQISIFMWVKKHAIYMNSKKG